MKKDFFEEKLRNIIEEDIYIPKSFTDSISSIEYKKKKQIGVNLYKKVAIAFSFFVISMNLVGYAFRISDIFKAESTVGYVNNSLQQAAENGYIQNVEMEYLYSNKIGAKVDYIIMSDNNLNILFNFDISNKNNMQNTLAEIEDLLIYDENNNIIYCYDYKTYKNFCKKKNIEYNENDVEQYANTFGSQKIEISSEINKTLYKIGSSRAFPKSKKIYIQFNTIYFNIEKSNKIKGKWKFELNLDEQFYNREEIKYELETKSKDIEIINANINNTMMKITYKIKNIDIGKLSNISMYMEDNLGNKYEANTIEEFIFIDEDKINVTFPIAINHNFKYLILYISIDNGEYISVILEPKK